MADEFHQRCRQLVLKQRPAVQDTDTTFDDRAGEVVRRVVSYGNIAAIINANGIEVIEAWGAFGGAITALH